jgi:hypothetical protein
MLRSFVAPNVGRIFVVYMPDNRRQSVAKDGCVLPAMVRKHRIKAVRATNCTPLFMSVFQTKASNELFLAHCSLLFETD